MSIPKPLALPGLIALLVGSMLAQPALAQRGKKPPTPTLSVTLTPNSIDVGATATGNVSLNITAPTSNVLVTLSSSVENAVTFNPETVNPETVTIQAGETSATFSVTAGTPAPTVTITATAEGYTSGSANLTITNPPPITYSIVWLTKFLGGGLWEQDVNSRGEVVGYAYDDISPDPRPFIWTPPSHENPNGDFQLLDDLVDTIELEMELLLGQDQDLRQGNTLRAAFNINDAGRIAGTGRNQYDERITFVFDVLLDPPLQFAPTPVGYLGYPRDMSSDGQILIENASPAYVWSPGNNLVELPNLQNVQLHYSRVNSLGQVVGSYGGEDGLGKIFRVDTADLSTVETLADWGANPHINDIGLIVGLAAGTTRKTKNSLFPSYYIEGSGWAPIDNFPADLRNSELNNAGQICGTLLLSDLKVPDTLYLFDPIEGFWSFNDLINPAEPLWFQGDYGNDCVPTGVSEVPTGRKYPFIVGYKQINGRSPFVLIPNE